MKLNSKGITAIAAILAIAAYTQLTIFVVQPIGAIPEGKTIVMLRLNKTEFIDSPDAMCMRIQEGVNLLCRGMVMAAVVNKTKILARLPYMDWLYLISTGGKRFDR
ncbi:hypothetical protein SAMN04244572_04135 [Azotobacter beijerinckii]|uniref:Uncharacterized protein n=1 Tax=Azotobacter beijerinckii TaxID=170623 RepID=A0A1H6Z753_9GAMM|nr:hypothetical protein [Azotobacter beijerinckii]SEJ47267.1 hypothetical protein SAMN04244572_04135 [Azotobacter beijerinckii]